MIVLLCIALGLGLRAITGNRLADLSRVKLRGETALLLLLVTQTVLPVISLSGVAARVAFFAWLATFPCMIFVAWLNRRAPGIPLLALGLLLNLVVIAANGGMPVFEAAVQIVKASTQTLVIPSGDFVHIVGGPATLLPWLADTIPMSGPDWLRAAVSPGDVLLFVGIVAFLGAVRRHSDNRSIAAD